MIYVTGDVHGDLNRKNIKAIKKLKKNDTAIICGDFGFVFDDSKEEKKALKKLSKYRCTILFVDGSHENHKLIKSHKTDYIYGNHAYKITDNIYCIMRGSVHIIEGNKILFIGGGQRQDLYSGLYLDMDYNDEFITNEDIDNAFKNLIEFNNDIDYVVTHEAPLNIKHFLTINEIENTSYCSIALQKLCEKINFKKWFFGYYHIDKVISNKYIATYDKLVNIEK